MDSHGLGSDACRMIPKREIIDAAAVLGLNPHVIGKDYVLGWLLWGIHDHEAIGENWMFKGGTCLKKCFIHSAEPRVGT